MLGFSYFCYLGFPQICASKFCVTTVTLQDPARLLNGDYAAETLPEYTVVICSAGQSGQLNTRSR